MGEFLNIAFSLPTVVFTVGVGVSLVYWLFVILGMLDVDLFDVDIDLDMDIDLDGVLDGAADSAVDASLGAADALGGEAEGIEGAAESKGGFLMKMLGVLSVGRVPVTILASFFSFYAWILTFIGTHWLTNIWGLPMNAPLAVGLVAGAAVVATGLMGVTARPLRGAFDIVTQLGDAALIGKVCTVSTGRVTTRFGQATLDDGGGGLNLTIRADTDENSLSCGDQALIVGYDPETSAFLVESYQTVLGFEEPEDHHLGVEITDQSEDEGSTGERV